MRAGKYTVAAQTIIFSVQLFGVYQGFYLLDVFPIRMVDAVVTCLLYTSDAADE